MSRATTSEDPSGPGPHGISWTKTAPWDSPRTCQIPESESAFRHCSAPVSGSNATMNGFGTSVSSSWATPLAGAIATISATVARTGTAAVRLREFKVPAGLHCVRSPIRSSACLPLVAIAGNDRARNSRASRVRTASARAARGRPNAGASGRSARRTMRAAIGLETRGRNRSARGTSGPPVLHASESYAAKVAATHMAASRSRRNRRRAAPSRSPRPGNDRVGVRGQRTSVTRSSASVAARDRATTSSS